MEQKSFSKFFTATLKRTAQNVYPLVRQRNKISAQIAEAQKELDSINAQLEAYEAPIKIVTGGYTTDDLVVREVINTGKVDKNGVPVKSTVYKLKYPDTVIPVADNTEAIATVDANATAEETVAVADTTTENTTVKTEETVHSSGFIMQ